ncbi:hypothetical protein GBP07_03800 [Pediococcus acidilactici]|jgi:hypothetical protein|uniref:hypothetical protein n=1 Tax=Pediococcus acidilactici TaxID=1254 RepID=UPI0006B52223|nr:hypothetical protein [Pediococcus acidilactici]KAF0366592.1 hypothetical protein GBO52_08290 [Pediococcus acidilactici]KAF0372085.1 hypothetical protein GBO58_06140 [Pediococcus acidilactici]KAF0382757.1 hypothetical protein GBO62_06055 [Pediococcus acidilactici]KAF0456557.1 hypothetical protein GBP02_06060 [Pediococcus acidilactici]KAF0466206.1 hypothetical protein GBP04_03495 [Pediococcus acidilactici]
MEKFKTFITQNKKLVYGVIAIIIIAAGAKIGYDYHSNNIISRIEVKFYGYNGHGDAAISNAESVNKYMTRRVLQKDHIKKDVINKIVSHPDTFDYSMLSSEDQYKIQSSIEDLSSTRLEFKGKSTELKNGDKVTVTFKNSNSELPFRDGKKTFTVKGLKKTTKVSSNKIFNQLKIKALGINGKGQIALSSKNSDLINSNIKVKNNGHLSNGDVISLTLPKAAFKDSSGKHQYTGSRTFKYKISGLIDSKSITNVDDITDATDTVMSDYTDDKQFADEKYTSKFVNLYVTPYNENEEEYYDDDDNEVSSKVEVADASENSTSSSNKLSIVAIYSVNSSDADDDDEPENVAVEVNNLSLNDGKLNIKDKKITSDDNVSTLSDSIKTYERNLEVSGLKLK